MGHADPPLGQSAPLRIEAVAFAPGTGRLVRRARSVFFDPTGENAKLASAFDQAPDGADVRAIVLDLLIEHDLQAAPFAMVRWTDTVELLVFGDVSLYTSVPTAPMVGGSGSSTWVEHRVSPELLSAEMPLQVHAGTAPEAGTNLRLGIAACDGFRLDLVTDQIESAATARLNVAPVEPLTDPAADQAADLADVSVTSDDAPAPSIAAAESVAAQHVAAASAPPAPPSGPPLDVPVSPLDVPAAVNPAGLAASGAAVAFGGASAPQEPGSAEVDLFQVEQPAAPAPGDGPILEFDAPAAPVAPVSPPLPGSSAKVLGVLTSSDLADVSITEPATLGRRPSPQPGSVAIVIDHPEVSRSHAAIGVDGWAITLTDLDSRNGTWVQPPQGSGLRRLDPGERIVLIDGMVVHLGSVDARFVWHASS